MDPTIIVYDSDGSGSSASSSLNLGNSDFNSSTSSLSSATSESSRDSVKRPDSPVLNCRDLPADAFQASSTQQFKQDLVPPSQLHFDLSLSASTQPRPQPQQRSSNPDAQTKVAANPFFDNIRQNQESLDIGRSLANLQPFEVPPVFIRNPLARSRLPPFLGDLVDLPPLQRADRLAREFHDIEEREQHRLQELMAWHASRNQSATRPQEFNPLSIAAGVEKGHLNRYRNVFPYEHTRVRLQKHKADESDYINASRIELRGSSLSYIATQGPMASSFDDFWQLIYQESVKVILMLTNLVEAGREKCGAYYRPGRYGDVLVETVEACEAASAEDERVRRRGPSGQQSAGGFFGPQSPHAAHGRLRRLLKVTHDSEPSRPHFVHHIHFASWPDFDVPPGSQEVLELIAEVNAARGEDAAPVLAHCSAGVGRTGCFIAIDVMLHSILHADQTAEGMSTEAGSSHGGLLPSRARATPPVLSTSPLHAVVGEMREQRMSMVANAAQYRFAYTAVLEGIARSV